jgi:D-alanine transaminase
MAIGPLAYWNGTLCSVTDIAISPFDRGFLFAHAAYEVTAVYGARFVDLAGHTARLARTLDGLDIPNPHTPDGWADLHQRLINANAMTEGLVYLQVTAGDYGLRDFAGPEIYTPNVFLYADAKPLIGAVARNGIRAVFIDDMRWKRRDMKTTQLLSQGLAYRAARAAGADTALMVEAGYVTEAASANAWIVTAAGELVTRQLSPAILSGITRAGIIALVGELGVTLHQRAFTPAEARAAREVFTSSAGAMIAPVTHLDGQPVGEGRPGPVTRRVQRAYYQAMGADVAAAAAFALA